MKVSHTLYRCSESTAFQPCAEGVGISLYGKCSDLFLFVLLLLLCMLSLCMNNPADSKASSEGITVRIFEPDGSKTATGVSIHLLSTGFSAGKQIETFTTDANGEFTIRKVAAGVYALWAETDSFVLFQDSVIISPEYNKIHDDTLEYPSSITGITQLQCGHNNSTVTIKIPGIGRSVMADAKGTFKIDGLAAGKYDCIASSTIEGYLPLETTVYVAVGRNKITDTLRLVYTGIPFVEGVRIIEDTANNIVSLSWKKTKYRNFQDYAVYRGSCNDVNDKSASIIFTLDTLIIDSVIATGKRESSVSIEQMTKSDTAMLCRRYMVAIRNRNQEIGPALGSEINFAPSGRITTFFDYNVKVVNHWCGDHQCTIASIHDTVEIWVAAKNFDRPLSKLMLYNKATKDTIASILAGDSLKNTLECSIRQQFDSAGTFIIEAIGIDKGGTLSTYNIKIEVIQDKPIVIVCNDTGVFCGTPVYLHGNAIEEYGDIISWQWKIGANEWVGTSAPEIAFTAPITEQELNCQFAAVDDDGNKVIESIKVYVSNKVRNIASNGNHNVFIKNDGNLWACGRNEFGQFGDGIQIGSNYELVRISAEVRQIAEGSGFSLILKNNGVLWGCGQNDYGQLGVGPTALQYPFPIQLRSQVKQVAAGGFHSMILDTFGILWSCGNNDAGQIGDSTMKNQYIPVKIMTGVKAIAAGEKHSLILTTDGTLYACGKNNYGQLGDSSMLDQEKPVRIMSGVEAISAGSYHSLILKSDGSLWACGQNNNGQLGVSITESWSLPVCVITEVKSIAVGKEHTLILKKDGSLLTCGNNSSGQLGDNSGINKRVPVTIMTDVNEIAAGNNHSLVLKTDGTVWGFGSNTYGQLGDNQATLYRKPIRIVPYQNNIRLRG